MSGVVDVGDAVELAFSATTGSTVTVNLLDPGQDSADTATLTESSAGSGRWVYVFVCTAPGVWTAVFTAAGAQTAVERYYVRATDPAGQLPPLAAVGDVAAQFGALTTAQESLTSWLLRTASRLVRSQFPAVDEQITAGQLDPDVVALVVANMVLRVLRNPAGLRAETIGPFSRTYDTTVAAGLLAISDQEKLLLTPLVLQDQVAYAIGQVLMRPGLAPPPRGLHRYRGW